MFVGYQIATITHVLIGQIGYEYHEHGSMYTKQQEKVVPMIPERIKRWVAQR